MKHGKPGGTEVEKARKSEDREAAPEKQTVRRGREEKRKGKNGKLSS